MKFRKYNYHNDKIKMLQKQIIREVNNTLMGDCTHELVLREFKTIGRELRSILSYKRKENMQVAKEKKN